MEYFNFRSMIKEPEYYENSQERNDFLKYSKREYFLNIEGGKIKGYSDKEIITIHGQIGGSELDMELALEEYNDFVSKHKNYKLNI